MEILNISSDETCNDHVAIPLNGNNNNNSEKNECNHKNNYIPFTQQENQINENELLQSNLFYNCVKLSPCSKLNDCEAEINVVDVSDELSNSITLEEENTYSISLKNKSRNVKCYKCHVCGVTFTEELSLKTHLKISHNMSETFCCSYCKKVFRNRSLLVAHVRIHTGEKPFKCKFCEKSFTQQPNMIAHMRIHSGNTPYKCTICKQKFNQKSLLETHKWKHTGIKPFKCSTCQRYFSSKSSLNFHLRSHLNVKTYKCHLCKKVFYRKSYLDFHLKTHSNTNIGQCSICKSVFQYESTLKRHMKKHSMEKSVTHEFRRGFPHKPSLLKHSNINKDEKTINSCASNCPLLHENNLGIHIKCNFCQKLYHKSIYHIHLKTHSEGKLCKLFNKEFSSTSILNSHLGIGKKYTCGMHIINKECMLKDSNKHLNEKYFNCRFCKRLFPSKISLIHHKRKIHQNDSYQCDQCKLSFFKKSKLLDHLKNHFSNMILQCQICKNTFTPEPRSKLHDEHIIQDKYLKMCKTCCVV